MPENYCTETLEYIENDVFFKSEVEQVSKDVDLAFIELLRSEISDEIDYRNSFLDSWFAVKKTLSVIRLKELPDNVLVLEITVDL